MSRRLALVLCTAIATVAVAPAAAPAAVPRQLYVSVGDSYASGYQPTGVGQGRNTRNGFAYQVPAVAARRGYRLKLVKLRLRRRDDGLAHHHDGLCAAGAGSRGSRLPEPHAAGGGYPLRAPTP